MDEMYKFIDYLKNTSAKHMYVMGGGEKVKTPNRVEVITTSYLIYEKKFAKFISIAHKHFDVYNYKEIIDIAYPDLYKKRLFDTKKKALKRYKVAISNADINVLSAMFTKELRLERFCEGHWISCQENGIFLALVERLLELNKH